MIKYHRYLHVHPEKKWKKVSCCGLSPIVGIDGLDTVVLLDLVTKLVAIISLTVSQREFQLITSALGGWCSGPEPAILNWYYHCVLLSVNKLGGLGACCCSRKIFKIRTSEIASEAMLGHNCY